MRLANSTEHKRNAEGKFHVIPQVISTIDPSKLLSVEQGAQGILAVIGVGTGLLEPKVLHFIDSTTGFTSRHLLDSDVRKAIEFAIAPSRETPGASDIRLLLVNPATKSTLTLDDGSATPVIKLDSRGWGVKFNDTTVQVDSTAKEIILKLDAVEETFEYSDTSATGELQELVDLLNDQSNLVSATLLAPGDDTLANLATTNMASGSDGTPTTQDWQDAFDLLATADIDLEHLVSADQTVQVAWAAHLDETKRFGLTGFDSSNSWNTFQSRSTSINNLLARSAALGSRQILFSGVGTDGQPSYISVGKYAGIAAGLDPVVPLTNKDLATTTVEADLFDSEIERLLLGGVAPPMRRRNRQRPGFVISRSLLTWTADDNLFNREFSVGRGARAIETEVKNALEPYVGQPGEPIIVQRAVSTVDRVLANATRSDVSARIVSYDRDAIRGLLEGTVLKIFYNFVPVLPINFPFAIGMLEPTVIEKTVELNLAGS